MTRSTPTAPTAPAATGGGLEGRVVRRSELGPGRVDQLYQLFRTYYTRVERAVFDRDLEEKDWVLLLLDAAGEVRGFTTLALYELSVHGRPVRAVFNGNTIVDAEHWGQQELVRTWTRFMAERKLEAETPLYWYLICSGFRTYLYLPLFYREFYPRRGAETPAFEQALLDTLGKRKFPCEYRDGVIRVSEARECLRSDLAEPPPHKARKPHVRFFLEANPGFRRGDELACIAEMRLDNIRGFPREIVRQVLEAGEPGSSVHESGQTGPGRGVRAMRSRP